MSLTLIFKNKERLPLGNKSGGRLVPPEKGRMGILVPSWGALEKEEVDYLVEVSQEKEDERIKTKRISRSRLEKVVSATLQAPEGQRAKTAQQVMKEV